MKPRDAILLTITLLLLTSLVGINIAGRNVPLIDFVVLGTAIWAAGDSLRMHLKRYKSGISCGPVILFLAVMFFWVLVFPWYLIVRHQIKTGTAILKDAAANVTA